MVSRERHSPRVVRAGRKLTQVNKAGVVIMVAVAAGASQVMTTDDPAVLARMEETTAVICEHCVAVTSKFKPDNSPLAVVHVAVLVEDAVQRN